MTVTIQDLRPKADAHPHHSRLVIRGLVDKARHNVQVFYELTANGVQSANLSTVSNEYGEWHVEVPGDFPPGTEVTAFARAARSPLAFKTKTI